MAKNDVRSGKIDIKGIVASGELEGTAEIGGGLSENQIVVYQPNETVRLDSLALPFLGIEMKTDLFQSCPSRGVEITKTQKGAVIDLGEWLKGDSGQLCVILPKFW